MERCECCFADWHVLLDHGSRPLFVHDLTSLLCRAAFVHGLQGKRLRFDDGDAALQGVWRHIDGPVECGRMVAQHRAASKSYEGLPSQSRGCRC